MYLYSWLSLYFLSARSLRKPPNVRGCLAACVESSLPVASHLVVEPRRSSECAILRAHLIFPPQAPYQGAFSVCLLPVAFYTFLSAACRCLLPTTSSSAVLASKALERHFWQEVRLRQALRAGSIPASQGAYGVPEPFLDRIYSILQRPIFSRVVGASL